MTSSKRQFLQQTASKRPIKESILIPHMTHNLNNGLVPSLCLDDEHSEPKGIFQKDEGMDGERVDMQLCKYTKIAVILCSFIFYAHLY